MAEVSVLPKSQWNLDSFFFLFLEFRFLGGTCSPEPARH